MLQVSRGGAKPRMLGSSDDLFITVRNARKAGMYEITPDGTVARRVELPGWLSDSWRNGARDVQRLILDTVHQPLGHSPGSAGHIYLRPQRDQCDGPAVGLDQEIFDRVDMDPGVKRVEFHVYAEGYELAAVWSIGAENFIRNCFRVVNSVFQPQMMVPVHLLAQNRTAVH